MEKINYIADWRARLRSRLYLQFRGKVTWNKWTDLVLGPQFQDLEDAAQSLLTLFDFRNNTGALLDFVGRYIQQPRIAADDATYISYIAGRIIANHSSGKVKDVFDVLRSILGSTSAPRYFPGLVKSFAVRITGMALTPAQAAVAALFLQSIKDAGARVLLEWREQDEASTFSFSNDPCLTSDFLTSGNVSVNVTSTDGFASSGTLFIDGTELVTYVSKTATSFVVSGIWIPLANHYKGAPVSQTGVDTGTGLGFDVGFFANAMEA